MSVCNCFEVENKVLDVASNQMAYFHLVCVKYTLKLNFKALFFRFGFGRQVVVAEVSKA